MPYFDDILEDVSMSERTVRSVLIACRTAIRDSSDARGDDRCWISDYRIWAFIKGAHRVPKAPPPHEEAMRRCHAYYAFRGTRTHTVVGSVGRVALAQGDRDIDLLGKTTDELRTEARRLYTVIHVHHAIEGVEKRPRIIDDDRALYAALPEGITTDFWLPPEEEFLGEVKAPCAGCPAFWRSHAHCAVLRHNLHQWGPCS